MIVACRLRLPELEAEQYDASQRNPPADVIRLERPLENGACALVKLATGRYVPIGDRWWILRRRGVAVRVASQRVFKANYEQTVQTV